MALTQAILKDCDSGDEVVINVSPFDVGRNKSAKMIIPHVSISRNHCHFLLNENKKWTIQDFSSSGTFVNGELVGQGKTVCLQDGYVIRFGPPESNFIWEFNPDEKGDGNSRLLPDDMEAQSQAIVDIAAQKNTLERKMIVHKESHVKIKNEREKLEKQFAKQIELMEIKYAKERDELQNARADMKLAMEQRAKEEKERIEREAEEKQMYFQQKQNENDQIEQQLKQEIQKMQERLEAEKNQWEANFQEEKKKLEEKLSIQEQEVEQNEKRWEDKLNKEEQEKHVLLLKLKEMEAAQNLLEGKLKETNEQHLLEKAKVEEEMLKEKIRQEEKLKEEIEKSLKAEMEKKESEKSQALMKELEEVRKSKDQLEKELAATSIMKDEASRMKQNLLTNITDVMESELNCSICSELFVTAITLNCTHTFCKFCINEWKKKKKNCPICRKKISSENRSIVMDNYIDKMVESFSKDLKERREIIIIERNGGVPSKKPKLEPAPPVTVPSTSQRPGPSNMNRTSSTTSTSSDGPGRTNSRPAHSPSGSIPNWASPIPTIDLTRVDDYRVTVPANVTPMNVLRLQRLPAIPAVRGPNQTQVTLPYQIITPSGRPIPPGARAMIASTVPTNRAPVNNQNIVAALRAGATAATVRLQATVGPNGQPQIRVLHPKGLRSDSDDDEDEEDDDSERYVDGVPGAYYGGYGHCYRCGRRGHWANGCPNRYSY